MKLHRSPLLLSAVILAGLLPAQSKVDLTAFQTPVKHQGSRGTCTTFTTIAAIEAAYARAGYGLIDMSEEFANYMGKVFWLHTNWSTPTSSKPALQTAGAGYTENQIGNFSGGNAMDRVEAYAKGMMVPVEAAWPYINTGNPYNSAYPNWQDPWWNVQRNADDFNLDPTHMPDAALKQPFYYSIQGAVRLSDPTSASQIEAALQSGREVLWSFPGSSGNQSGNIWTHSGAAAGGGHAMLIVGYDRSSRSSANHHFICKNSWGATSNPGGYTHISYGYLQYGYQAGYITGVNPPKPWPELAFVGRWNLSYDGWQGILDVHHIPGVTLSNIGVKDRRVGTFYDAQGTPHRVNGSIVGDRMKFWFKRTRPNMRWDESATSTVFDRQFTYFMADPEQKIMAGFHTDASGSTWGGYAGKPTTIQGLDGFLSPVFNPALAGQPEQYLGTYDISVGGMNGKLHISRRDDKRVPVSRRATHAGLVAVLDLPQAPPAKSFVAEVERANPQRIDLRLPLPGGTILFEGRMLSWQAGVIAAANVSVGQGLVAHRTGNSIGSGQYTYFQGGCVGTNGTPALAGVGLPNLGNTFYYRVSNAPPSASVFLLLAGGTQPAPLNLGPMGAPSCLLEVSIGHILSSQADGSGTVFLPQSLPVVPGFVGAKLATQALVHDPMANQLGFTSSNRMDVMVGM